MAESSADFFQRRELQRHAADSSEFFQRRELQRHAAESSADFFLRREFPLRAAESADFFLRRELSLRAADSSATDFFLRRELSLRVADSSNFFRRREFLRRDFLPCKKFSSGKKKSPRAAPLLRAKALCLSVYLREKFFHPPIKLFRPAEVRPAERRSFLEPVSQSPYLKILRRVRPARARAEPLASL